MQERFLLADTPEAEKERKKVIDLLLLPDAENQVLGLSILEGGGVHTSMWTALVGLYMFSDSKEVENRIGTLINQQEYYWEVISYLEEYADTNSEWEYLLEAEDFFLKHKFLNKTQLALFGLFHQQMGLNYCLENQVLSPQNALTLFLENDSLDISDKQLKTLPKEIAHFKNITYLNIGYNQFTEVPDELALLTKLKTLHHYNTPLSQNAIQKLETFFPKIYAIRYHDEAVTACQEYKNKEEAESKIKRALELDNTEANFLVTKSVIVTEFEKNYIKAIELLHKAIEIGEEASKTSLEGKTLTLAWANLAADYCRLGKNETALWAADKGFEVYQNYPQTALEWEKVLYFRKG